VGTQTAAHAADLRLHSACAGTHREQLATMDVGLLNHKDELRRVSAQVAVVEQAGGPQGGLQSTQVIQSALNNHCKEIWLLKGQPSVAEQLSNMQRQINLLHTGLMNHKAVLAAKPEAAARAATSVQRSDLDMRLRLGR